MVEKVYVTGDMLSSFFIKLVGLIDTDGYTFSKVVGIERGGIPLATAFSKHYGVELCKIRISFYDGEVRRDQPIIDYNGIVFTPDEPVLIVDDLIDTGDTIQVLKKHLDELEVPYRIATFYKKPHASCSPDYYAAETQDWIVFPWELQEETAQT